jgi:hypothetical protein
MCGAFDLGRAFLLSDCFQQWDFLWSFLGSLLMTSKQIELARHALGLKAGNIVSFRNSFVTGPGSSDYPHWVDMVEAGDALNFGNRNMLFGGDYLFCLTFQGASKALRQGESLDGEDFPNVALENTTKNPM